MKRDGICQLLLRIFEKQQSSLMIQLQVVIAL